MAKLFSYPVYYTYILYFILSTYILSYILFFILSNKNVKSCLTRSSHIKSKLNDLSVQYQFEILKIRQSKNQQLDSLTFRSSSRWISSVVKMMVGCFGSKPADSGARECSANRSSKALLSRSFISVPIEVVWVRHANSFYWIPRKGGAVFPSYRAVKKPQARPHPSSVCAVRRVI